MSFEFMKDMQHVLFTAKITLSMIETGGSI